MLRVSAVLSPKRIAENGVETEMGSECGTPRAEEVVVVCVGIGPSSICMRDGPLSD